MRPEIPAALYEYLMFLERRARWDEAEAVARKIAALQPGYLDALRYTRHCERSWRKRASAFFDRRKRAAGARLSALLP